MREMVQTPTDLHTDSSKGIYSPFLRDIVVQTKRKFLFSNPTDNAMNPWNTFRCFSDPGIGFLNSCIISYRVNIWPNLSHQRIQKILFEFTLNKENK